jgi:hypothetical protein
MVMDKDLIKEVKQLVPGLKWEWGGDAVVLSGPFPVRVVGCGDGRYYALAGSYSSVESNSVSAALRNALQMAVECGEAAKGVLAAMRDAPKTVKLSYELLNKEVVDAFPNEFRRWPSPSECRIYLDKLHEAKYRVGGMFGAMLRKLIADGVSVVKFTKDTKDTSLFTSAGELFLVAEVSGDATIRTQAALEKLLGTCDRFTVHGTILRCEYMHGRLDCTPKTYDLVERALMVLDDGNLMVGNGDRWQGFSTMSEFDDAACEMAWEWPGNKGCSFEL